MSGYVYLARPHTRIARDDRCCDAIAETTRRPHRCSNGGAAFRAGRWVCSVHRDFPPVAYVCGNRFDMLAAAMAPALEPKP
jgi:hypothetical protein